jgi:23S rRNA (cytosine1962-C5)-methyltransferase
MSQPSVLLGKSGVLRLRDGHPWIYSDELAPADGSGGAPAHGPAAGLVAIEGPAGRRRGYAVWSPRSRIALRVVSRDPAADITEDFWRARLDAAIAARAMTLAPGEAACRWVHAEADGLPGLVVDRYADVAVLQAGCQWADEIAPAVARHLVERHGVSGVLARHDGSFRRPEGLAEGVVPLAGDVPHAVRWESEAPGGRIARTVDPWTGQKTGAYLDQRENHRRAAELLPVGRCLDSFCHDGGFALHLARAGSQVLALDSSDAALAAVVQNAIDNGLSERITPVKVNVFDDLRARVAAAESFDGIVLDPPAHAKRRGERDAALRGYKELNLRALRLLRPGGRLMSCSCSFHVGAEEFLDVLRAAAADAARDVRLVERRSAAPCHPARLAFPESSYLKVVVLEVTGAW